MFPRHNVAERERVKFHMASTATTTNSVSEFVWACLLAAYLDSVIYSKATMSIAAGQAELSGIAVV